MITSQPTPADLDKVLEVDDLAMAEQDDDGLPTVHVLLTRVIKRTIAQSEARQILLNNELKVFDAEIYNRQDIALQHGFEINPDQLHGYEDVVTELLQIHKEAITNG